MRSGIPLLRNDVLLGYVAIRMQEGDDLRAVEVLASAHAADGGLFRSPGGFGLYRAQREQLCERLDPVERRAAVARGRTFDADEVLELETERLEARYPA